MNIAQTYIIGDSTAPEYLKAFLTEWSNYTKHSFRKNYEKLFNLDSPEEFEKKYIEVSDSYYKTILKNNKKRDSYHIYDISPLDFLVALLVYSEGYNDINLVVEEISDFLEKQFNNTFEEEIVTQYINRFMEIEDCFTSSQKSLIRDKVLYRLNIKKYYKSMDSSDIFLVNKFTDLRKYFEHFDMIFYHPITKTSNNTNIIEQENVSAYVQWVTLKDINKIYNRDEFPFARFDDKPALIEIFGSKEEQISLTKLYLASSGDMVGQESNLITDHVGNTVEDFEVTKDGFVTSLPEPDNLR